MRTGRPPIGLETKDTNFTIRISKSERDTLNRIANKLGTTASKLLREAINQYLINIGENLVMLRSSNERSNIEIEMSEEEILEIIRKKGAIRIKLKS